MLYSAISGMATIEVPILDGKFFYLARFMLKKCKTDIPYRLFSLCLKQWHDFSVYIIM